MKTPQRQQALIDTVVKKIPDTISYPEYQEYQELQTRKAATDFLNAVMEREEQAEDIGKLVTYMAERPGVVKIGKHGLFSQTDDPIDLEKAAEEVANHDGYIWIHVVSLQREDKCLARRQALQAQIDSKLQAKIQEKKQAMGLRTETTQKPTYQTQEEYNMSM